MTKAHSRIFNKSRSIHSFFEARKVSKFENFLSAWAIVAAGVALIFIKLYATGTN